MKRRLSPQEQLLVGLGAVVILLLLVYAVITGLTSDQYRGAQRELARAEGEYKNAVELHERYEQLGREIEERQKRITKRSPLFDLPSFIASDPLKYSTVSPPSVTPFAGEKYMRTRIRYEYERKRLDEIARFLYRIENPKLGIIISGIHFKAASHGDKLSMTITLVLVTEQPAPGQ